MFDLNGIARHLKVSVDQLRIAADLIEQGFSPTFIEKYRGDETNSLPGSILRRLKYEIDRRKRTEASKQRVLRQLPKDAAVDSELERSMAEAHSAQAAEVAARCFRVRRTLDQSQERVGQAGKLLEAMLTYSGPAVDDIKGWVASQLENSEQDPELVLAQVGRLVATLMNSDTSLNSKLRHYVERNAILSVVEAPTPPDANLDTDDRSSDVEAVHHSESTPDYAETADLQSDDEHAGLAHFEDEQLDQAHEELLAVQSNLLPDNEGIASQSPDQVSQAIGDEQGSSESGSKSAALPESDQARTSGSDSSEVIGIGVPPSQSATTTQRQTAKLTPRQRRRRWLLSVLNSMKSLKKPLQRISAYQQLMLARGVRSHLIATPLSYDVSGLVEIARNAFTDAKHPLAEWFRHTVGQALEHGLRAKIEADALAEMEERACESLLEHATDELQRQLMRRPVRGHTIALIDTVGPKTVSVVFVDPVGKVLACEELPCSVQPEIVSQSVVRLGEWIHKHRVTLVALTNGPARRFMMATLRELMVQSKDSGLRWTLADRSGAEAYAGGRIGLRELSIYNRRQRAAIWTARCMQDPLVELLKVDINRMRLGSFQRELPQDALRQQIKETLSACVCVRGIDTQNASEFELQFIPGVGPEQAKQIANLARAGCLMSRSQLAMDVSDWSELDRRHAIGWLRVFGGENPLDATLIHPDDYRLAQRLIEHSDFSAPPNAPPGWFKRHRESTAKTESRHNPAAESAPAQAVTGSDAGLESVDMPQVETEFSNNATKSPSEAIADNNSTIELQPTDTSVAADAASVTMHEPQSEVTEILPKPEYPEQCLEPSGTSISIDCERLANSWQVGRAKLRAIASCLADPFADPRLSGVPIPMLTEMPTLENLQPDMCVWAVVVGVADFGAFVELGPNCSGLIHISRLSTQFIEDPHQCVQVGDLLLTWVVSIDHKKNRVALTALSPSQRSQMQAESEAKRVREEEERQQRGRGYRKDQQQDRGFSRGQRQTTAISPGSGGTSKQSHTSQGREGGSHRSLGPGAGRSEGGNRGQRIGGQSQFGQGREQVQGGVGKGLAGAGQGKMRSDQGQGQSQNRTGQGNRSGGVQISRSGGSGRGQGRDSGTRPAKTIVVKSKKPVAPITQAMKQGDEPLRSFSDLMQFYESKRTVPSNDVVELHSSSLNFEPGSVTMQPAPAIPESIPLEQALADSDQTLSNAQTLSNTQDEVNAGVPESP